MDESFTVGQGSVIVVEKYIPIDAKSDVLEVTTEMVQSTTLIQETTTKELQSTTSIPEIVAKEFVTTTVLPPKPKSSRPRPVITELKKRPSPFLFKKSKTRTLKHSQIPERKFSSAKEVNLDDTITKNIEEEVTTRTTRFDKFKRSKQSSTISPVDGNSAKTKEIELNAPGAIVGGHLFHTITTTIPHLAESSTNFETVTSELASITNEGTEVSSRKALESITTEVPSSTPDIFAMFQTTLESSTQNSNDTVTQTTDKVNLHTTEFETETPFLAFETFVKTTSNGGEFFADSGKDNENNTAFDKPSTASHDEGLDKNIEPEIEFLADSDFVPFNEFLNTQTATEKFNEAFEILPEADEAHLSANSSVTNNSSNFLTWLRSEVKSRQQLGGKEFLHHLIKSGVSKELTFGKYIQCFHYIFIVTLSALYKKIPRSFTCHIITFRVQMIF